MGVPVIDAPCEAEAQCSVLAREGLVYATCTEDMDALTFQTPKLIRGMTFGKAGNTTVMEVDYSKLIAGMKLTHAEFVDLCILCGCDYTSTIRGIGPKTALSLIRKYGSIEKILPEIEAKNRDSEKKTKNDIPVEWNKEKLIKMRKLARRQAKLEAKRRAMRAAQQQEQEKNEEETTAKDNSISQEDKENELGALSGVKRASDKISDSEEDGAKQKEEAKTEKHVDKKIKLSENEEERYEKDPIEEVDSENSSKKANESESDKKETMMMMKEEKDETDEKVAQKEEKDKQEEEEVEDEIEEIDSDDEDDEEDEEEPVPEYICARELFVTPEVERDIALLDSQLKWSEPDEAGLIAFLVDKLGFNQARVESGIKKLKDAKGKSSQKRMDSFFKITGTATSTKKKEEPKGKGKGAAGKKKAGAMFNRKK